MNAVETTLIYAGSPAGLALVLAAGVYGRTMVHSSKYRPGREWTHDPVWYLPHGDVAANLPPANQTQALTGGPSTITGATVSTPADDLVGGASGEW